MDNLMTISQTKTASEVWDQAKRQIYAGTFNVGINTERFAGGPFSAAAALNHFMSGTGKDMRVSMDAVNPGIYAANQIPNLWKLIKQNYNKPGTYQFRERFGHQTYYDGITKGAFLGGIVLVATGSVTINANGEYYYQASVSQAGPDPYDADPKAPGERPFGGEPSTWILRELGGTSYNIYI